MVKHFQGADLAPEALTPTAADRAVDPLSALAYLLTECSPGGMARQIGVAAVRRLIEAEGQVETLVSHVGALEAENALLREELSQTTRVEPDYPVADFLHMED